MPHETKWKCNEKNMIMETYGFDCVELVTVSGLLGLPIIFLNSGHSSTQTSRLPGSLKLVPVINQMVKNSCLPMRRFDRIGLNNEMEEIQFASIFTVYRLTYTYTKKSALSIVEKTWQTGRSKNSSVNLNNMFTFKVSRRQSTVVISL